ncbi:JAB domain-containing protein [Kosakonia cowanii]
MREDKAITELVIKFCQIIEILVIDHLVIVLGDCVSFSERVWI